MTSLYSVRLFPGGISSCCAMDYPDRFFGVPTKRNDAQNNSHLFSVDARSFFTQTLQPQAKANHQQNSIEILSALKNLVVRLEEYEHNFPPPRLDDSTLPLSTSSKNETNQSVDDTSLLLSVEENARIFSTGYSSLPPLKLAWVATSAANTTENTAADAINNKRFPSDVHLECPRSAVLYFLAQQCGLPSSKMAAAELSELLKDLSYQANLSVLQKLRQAWTPKFEEVFQCLLEQNSQHTLNMLVELRADLLRVIGVLPKQQKTNQHQGAGDEKAKGSASIASPPLIDSMQQLERHLRRILSAWVSPGMLEIKRITYDTTAAGIIEKIAVKEAVHPMKSLDDLRRRLGPKRRVFALFHPLLPNEPLVILHVHLEAKEDHIPSAMPHVLTEDGSNPQCSLSPRTATFYSISNTQHGLTRGLGLGEFLIKNAVQILQKEFPSSLDTFVTLSPMPTFRKWVEGIVTPKDLENEDDEEWASRLSELGYFSAGIVQDLKTARPALKEILRMTSFKSSDPGYESYTKQQEMIDQRLDALKPIIMDLAAHYLVVARNRRSGKPLDPVMAFHTHNGAIIYRINFAADLSRKGLSRSLGVMVNYQYRLEVIEKNKELMEAANYSHLYAGLPPLN